MADEVRLNILTAHMRAQLAKISSGAITAMSPITHIAFGDGGVNVSGNPLVPSESMASLANEVGRYAVESVSYPIPTTARYTAVIPEGELVGVKISEVGLIDSGGGLCAVQNMFIKHKDDGIEFRFTFDNEF